MSIDYKIYLVTDRRFLKNISLKEAVEESIKGGASIIQIREKEATTREFFNIASEIHDITKYYNVPLIINDRIDIAQAIKAEGVHLGQDDMPIEYARKILGEDIIIGISCGNVYEALEAQNKGANYLGLGAVFSTNTKKDIDIPIGLNGLKEITSKIHIPSVAIGGVNHSNAKSVMETGVSGLSVISCILGSNNIKKATEELKKIMTLS
ncbi:thiamine phosphate synthase [Haloimpatiens massiliensis]|uniref:thiamine phosphate synthase n=1 Tax=Haloimpatiens massiliensis TaxID=1658110 RepID=UPI000C851FDE|nr:thiamine phosphate synthase [Haloimpatiens massiliensis]